MYFASWSFLRAFHTPEIYYVLVAKLSLILTLTYLV